MVIRTCSYLISSACVAVVSSWHCQVCRSSSCAVSAIETDLWLARGDRAIIADRASWTVKFVLASGHISVGTSWTRHSITCSCWTEMTHWAFVAVESCYCCVTAGIASWAGTAFLFGLQEAFLRPSSFGAWNCHLSKEGAEVTRRTRLGSSPAARTQPSWLATCAVGGLLRSSHGAALLTHRSGWAEQRDPGTVRAIAANRTRCSPRVGC